MYNRKAYLLGIFSIVLLILSFFYLTASVPLHDYDFWWHIATGRHIVETGSLPDSDPFSYVSTLDENKNLHSFRENFILKQYWLAQVLFYHIYDYAGPTGIILLRTTILILTICLVFWRLQRWEVSLPISFITIYILYTIITRSMGERPVLFTILLSPLVFFILEHYKEKKDSSIFLLLPVMILWSNLHGGFILGVVTILTFMAGEGVKIVLKKNVFSKKENAKFYIASILGLGCSFVNPTGWDAFIVSFSTEYLPFTEGIQEYQSPLFYFKNMLYPHLYGYFVLVGLFPVVLLLRNAKIDITHIILLSGLLYASIEGSRFIIFYATISAMILGKEVDAIVKKYFIKKIPGSWVQKGSSALLLGCLLSAILFSAGLPKLRDFKFAIATDVMVPERAVKFIKKNTIEGNIFNDYGYGGYLLWTLHPRKIFIDSRALNLTVMREFSWITSATETLSGAALAPGKLPLWEKLLNHYDVNVIILPLIDVYGDPPLINFTLIEENKWVPVYCDPITIVFVKNSPRNKEIIQASMLSKDNVYNTIIYVSVLSAMQNKVNARHLITIGDIFYKMGRPKDALIAFQYAMKRLPREDIQERIQKIEYELRGNHDDNI